jgi:phage gp36-like protein
MDGYLRSAVALPLREADIAKTPLKTCCLELTRCQLADDPDNATELQEKRCKRWDVWLRDVANGTVRLLPSPVSAVRKVRWGNVPSIYDGFGQ